MTRTFQVEIEINESKLDEDTRAFVDEDLNKRWLEDVITARLEDENVPADVFVTAT